FRQPRPMRTPPASPPRRRGGVPHDRGPGENVPGSSPPTRGCSVVLDDTVVAASVLPADAGVFRPTAPISPGRRGPPRRRGGVPANTTYKVTVAASSPPTRGCSAARSPDRPRGGVLPADAGVFRRGRRRRT